MTMNAMVSSLTVRDVLHASYFAITHDKDQYTFDVICHERGSITDLAVLLWIPLQCAHIPFCYRGKACNNRCWRPIQG